MAFSYQGGRRLKWGWARDGFSTRASEALWMFSRTVNAQLSLHPMPAGPPKALASLRMGPGKGRPGGDKWAQLLSPFWATGSKH